MKLTVIDTKHMIDLALIFLRLKKTVAFQEIYTAENNKLRNTPNFKVETSNDSRQRKFLYKLFISVWFPLQGLTGWSLKAEPLSRFMALSPLLLLC